MDSNTKVRKILDDLMDFSVDENTGNYASLLNSKRDILFLHLLREISDSLYILKDDWQEIRNTLEKRYEQ